MSVDYESLWKEGWERQYEVGPLGRALNRVVLKMLSPFVAPGKRLLDVGCGNGKLLAEFHHRFPELELQGLEGASTAVGQIPEPLKRQVKIVDLNQGFNSPDRKFDIITCIEVLEHLRDYFPALAGIRHALSPDGKALITVPHSMRYWNKHDEYSGHFRRFDYEAFQEELRQQNFKILQYFSWGFPVAYIYNKVASQLNPEKLRKVKPGLGTAIISEIYFHLSKLDDLFRGRRWHQLIVLVEADG